MSDTGAYQTQTITVPAGETQLVAVAGSYVACIASSLASFSISVDGNPSASFAQGLKFRMPAGKAFSNLTIDNSAGTAPLTATLAFGNGDFQDNRFIDATPSLQSIVTQADVACAAGAVTQIIGADTSREAVIICNPLINPREVRLGDANVGATRGYELVPGNSITLNTTQAVYVWNPHTAAMDIAAVSVEA